MVAATRAAGVTMAVNYGRRWYPDYCEARRLVRTGALGPLSTIVAISGGPRAMLWRNHTHTIDILNFLADSEAEWVWADLEPGFEDYGTAYRGDGGNDPATEPGGNFYITYRNGVRAFFSGVKAAPPGELTLTLLGPKGKVIIDLVGMRLITVETTDVRTRAGTQTVEIIQPRATVAGMQAAVRDLIDSLEAGRDTQSPPETARQVVAITDALLLSQARGHVPVRLSELAAPSVTSVATAASAS
jgi:predicted dehydrogenase